MSGPIPPSDKTRNWPACNEAQKQRGFLTMKALFGMPPRQTTGFIESLLRLVGIDRTGRIAARSAGARRPSPRSSPIVAPKAR